jgi:hypothetical protein
MHICGCGRGKEFGVADVTRVASKHWWLGLLLFVCFFLLVASLVSSLWPVASLYFELFPFLMQ